MYLEVESNPNCEGSVFLRFREQGPARSVRQVRTYDRITTGEWCTITGLQGEMPGGLCEAYAQPVEDSGAGTVYLVRGGLWGVRLQAVTEESPWNLTDSRQWGEPYLLLADARDICFADENHGA
ncbi:MAG TPA: hypothetical protein VGJ57_09880 [Nitrospirales bacterium]|jgi:hypothetical protein